MGTRLLGTERMLPLAEAKGQFYDNLNQRNDSGIDASSTALKNVFATEPKRSDLDTMEANMHSMTRDKTLLDALNRASQIERDRIGDRISVSADSDGPITRPGAKPGGCLLKLLLI